MAAALPAVGWAGAAAALLLGCCGAALGSGVQVRKLVGRDGGRRRAAPQALCCGFHHLPSPPSAGRTRARRPSARSGGRAGRAAPRRLWRSGEGLCWLRRAQSLSGAPERRVPGAALPSPIRRADPPPAPAPPGSALPRGRDALGRRQRPPLAWRAVVMVCGAVCPRTSGARQAYVTNLKLKKNHPPPCLLIRLQVSLRLRQVAVSSRCFMFLFRTFAAVRPHPWGCLRPGWMGL